MKDTSIVLCSESTGSHVQDKKAAIPLASKKKGEDLDFSSDLDMPGMGPVVAPTGWLVGWLAALRCI